MKVYELTEPQLKAFKALKVAAKKCNKLKIGFFNVLDTTFAYDRNMIEDMEVDANYDLNCLEYGYPYETMKTIGGCSYADDQRMHSIKLTPKGLKSFDNESNQDD